jgi:hypothetical protein
VKLIIPDEKIQRAIYFIRGMKVMLDTDLAELYGVPTRILNQAVRRNADRFPADFMFVLGRQEVTNLRSQIVTSRSWGGTRYLPMAFTEQGVAMLSTVLGSPRAIQVNIAIMRTFVRLRQLMSTHADLARRLDELEKKYDTQFKMVFDAIRELMAPPDLPQKQIGFHVREPHAPYGDKPRQRKKHI